MFPLPFLNCFPGGNRRGLRSKQRTRVYNDAVWSLNWLSGTAPLGPPPGNPANQNGHEVAARSRRFFVTAPTSVGAPVPEVALKELLRGRGVYEVAPRVWISRHTVRTWCHYQRVWMDLRNSLTCCRQRFPFFWTAKMSLCEGRGKRRTLSLKTGGVVKPYMDSVLRHNKKRYLTFLRQLLSRGMLNFVEWAKTLAGVFFLCGSRRRQSYGVLQTRDQETCSSRFLLRWACALRKLFPGSRLNETISGFLMSNRFLLVSPASHGAGYGRRVGLFSTA